MDGVVQWELRLEQQDDSGLFRARPGPRPPTPKPGFHALSHMLAEDKNHA